MFSEIQKTLKGLWAIIPPNRRKGGFVCVAVMVAVALMEIIAASVIVLLASTLTSSGDKSSLIPLALLCVLVFAVKSAAALFDSFCQNRWIQDIILDCKKQLIERATSTDYAYQIMRNSSQSLSVLFSDADIYMRIGLISLGIMFSEILVFAILMAFLLYLQPAVTAVLLVMFAALAAGFILYLAPVFRKWGAAVQDAAQKSYQEALQILQSYKDILIFGKKDFFIDRYMNQSHLRAQATVKSGIAQVLPRISIEVIFILFFAGLVITYSSTGQNFDQLTGVLGAYLYAGFRLLPGLNRILIQLNNVKMAEPSIERVVVELGSPYDKSAYIGVSGLTFNNNITVQNLTYRYPNAERDSLSNINLEIRKGEFIGIAGETGSGKSTLLHLLLGLIVPQSGSVLIDGKYPAHAFEWHKKIGYVAQSFHLIDGTIADNIAFGIPQAQRDPALLHSVVKGAQLEKFIAKLPQGLETEIGEMGARVSGGERQRIALARALYNRPEILMLDEATSALDLETEASLMQAIDHLKNGELTIIAVTHRMATLKNADRVITIDQGRIREETARKKIAGQ